MKESAMGQTAAATLPEPLTVVPDRRELDELLATEWLLTNRRGAYASSTVVGCNTRRYHGLLVAATAPPMGRVVALSSVMERVVLAGRSTELATHEFPGAISPDGWRRLATFRQEVAVSFVFRFDGPDGPVELTKEVLLADNANAAAVRYTLRGAAGTLHLQPLVALRDFHALRRHDPATQMTYRVADEAVCVEQRDIATRALHLRAEGARFEPAPDWWYRFYYRAEVARGQDAFEDLYTPGRFVIELDEGASSQFTASLDDPHPMDFATDLDRRRRRLSGVVAGLGDSADQTDRRLAVASEAFVAARHFANRAPSPTLLAGYPWFADWGRDAFIALPGLLLETGRFEEARGVFTTFADRIADGLVPNRFDDYGDAAHYNSIDASLWFIVAAERFCRATGDDAFWRQVLLPAAQAILTSYAGGTRFDIRADADMLLTGGSRHTQLTWMDAKLGDEVVTPRHGKAVEVNALWHSANRIVAARAKGADDALADRFAEQAALIARAFGKAFWNADAGCLYDCLTDGQADASLRPNQILAVSLPYSPLTREQQRGVVSAVERHLLTPAGLRTLAASDSRYRRRYGGSWESRDRSYHQGTVWAWLIGPFVEALLKSAADDGDPVAPRRVPPFALERARAVLAPFDGQLTQAGLGFISEIFDAEAPHTPRGCIAQAWSVGEVLRARRLLARCEPSDAT
ncbi:MAG: glycogen debranching enzyme family protein [Phycisphaerae bacterium]|nr:glycogen debranching enzyme family protein [Phycisphaerae bacterium]